MQELCRRLPCSQRPQAHVDVTGIAFDHSSLPVLHVLEPLFTLHGESHTHIDDSDPKSYDIPCSDAVIETSVSFESNSSHGRATGYSRFGMVAVFIFIIDALMVLLFDAQLMAVSAASPAFTNFWIAQLVVASISLLFFACYLCWRHWHLVLEAIMASVCVVSNIFILLCASMVIAQFNFSGNQIYGIRMAFLATRSFNCLVHIVAFRNHVLKWINLCTTKDVLQSKGKALPKTFQKPSSATLQSAALQPQIVVGESPFRRQRPQTSSSMLKRLTNRISLVESSQSLQDYVSCIKELACICQPQNRLLVSLSNVWDKAIPEAFDILSESSLGGHIVVDCSSDGHCGLVELFGICSLICQWLQSNRLNTVIIFHQGSRSCAAILTCCVFMASGLTPRSEHALHLVMLCLMQHEDRYLGSFTSACSRRMLRHFECFLHAEHHPVSASPRFLSMIVLKGCTLLPPKFAFSVDVICGGTTKVKLGKWVKSFAGDYISQEINCKLSSAGTYTFTFEANSIFCRGDVELIVSVQRIGNSASVKVARVWSHSSFRGVPAPQTLCYNTAEVDWFGSEEAMPRFFTDIELHFEGSQAYFSNEPAASVFVGQLVHFDQPAFNSKLFLSALLSKGCQIQFRPGFVIKTDDSNRRNSCAVVILHGMCSVELVCSDALTSAYCILQGLTAGQMLPSLKVI